VLSLVFAGSAQAHVTGRHTPARTARVLLLHLLNSTETHLTTLSEADTLCHLRLPCYVREQLLVFGKHSILSAWSTLSKIT
jgi:hypothetical protein